MMYAKAVTTLALLWVSIVFTAGCESALDDVELGSGASAQTSPDNDSDTDEDNSGVSDPETDEQALCGGLTGATCNDTDYCAYDIGDGCGAADASSVCKPRPEICTMDYSPVCGCDGKTYSNRCGAAAAGTGIMSEGECP